MERRKKPPEPGAPLWMCTFGDLMALLLCFFIMIFAISIIAEPRFQALADTLRQDFTGHAGSARTVVVNPRTIATVAESASRSRRVAALAGHPTPSPEGESRRVHTILHDGQTIRVIRFELGRYELDAQAQWDLRQILPTLAGSTQQIMVKGYSAASENGNIYGFDTDLAYLRALAAMDYIVSRHGEEYGLSQGYFEIAMEPRSVPNRAFLPAGTDPEYAGASVEIILLNQVRRQLRE